MGTNAEENVKTGAANYLDPNEPIVATLIASVRGHQQAMAGGVAGMIGGQRAQGAHGAAHAAGIKLASPMALVITAHRLLMFKTGGRGVPKELLNEFQLADVDSFEVKRVGLGAAVTLTIRGTPVKLESRVGAARALGEELKRLKAA